jgi:F-box-like
MSLIIEHRKIIYAAELVSFENYDKMDTLPQEVLSRVFSYLENRDLLIVSEVCWTFFQVLSSRVFMKKLCANVKSHSDFLRSSRRFLKVKIEHSDLQNVLESCTFKKPEISNGNPALLVESLKFDNMKVLASQLLRQIIQSFQNLIELHLEGVYLIQEPSKVVPVALPQLKALSFFYCSNSLLEMFREIVSLETFKICLIPHENENDRIRNYNLVSEIIKNNQNSLEKLSFYDINFDDRFLEAIADIHLCRLSKLALSFSSYLTPESQGFEKFVKCNAATLEKFKIRTFDHINQQQLAVVLNNALNLRSLDIIICAFCDFQSWFGLGNLSKLENLKIHTAYNCSSDEFAFKKFLNEKIFNNRAENVKKVNFAMFEVDDQIANKIVFAFPNLEKLHLPFGPQLELPHLQLFKEKLLGLKEIYCNSEIIHYKSAQ